MQYILFAHKYFQWVVIAAGSLTAGKQIYNLLAAKPYPERDRLFLTIFIRTLEIEAGFGAILIIREIFFRDSSRMLLIHGLIGLVPLGLAYLLADRQILWANKVKPTRILFSILILILLILGVGMIAPDQPAAEKYLILSGHEEAVRSVEFSPDQKKLATGSFDGTIRLWDLENGSELLEISANENPVRTIAFSSQGEYLSSGSIDKHINIWTLADGLSFLDIPAHQASINKVIWEDDRLYSTSLDNSIRVWDPENGDLLKEIEHNHTEGILSLALSPDGTLLASGGINGSIELHSPLDGSTSYLGGHAGWVYDLDFSQNGKYLASGSMDGTVILWDLSSQSNLFQSQKIDGPIQTVAFSPDSSVLLGGGADSNIYIWDVETYQLIDKLAEHQRGVLDLNFSADGQFFASASADNSVIIWRMTSP
jgi:WD40 repeat protein